MAVLTPNERTKWWAPDVERCLVCGETFAPDAVVVFWSGNGDLVLHAQCARQLGAHLIADSREAELAGSPEPHWGRRAGAALAARRRMEKKP